MKSMKRREFLGDTAKASLTASAVAAGLAAGAAVAQAQMKPAASDRIRVGLIGAGDQGKADLGAFLRMPEIDCPAVCDVDEKRLAEGVKRVADARGKARLEPFLKAGASGNLTPCLR